MTNNNQNTNKLKFINNKIEILKYAKYYLYYK